jgi:predicted acyl esterase
VVQRQGRDERNLLSRFSQWFTAAEQPPHLAAINPCEGFSDVYRDLIMRGGMPDIGFAERLQKNSYAGGFKVWLQQ